MKKHAPGLALVLFAAAPAAAAQCAEWVRGFGYPGFDKPALAFETFDDGTGPELYVGGTFTNAGGLPIRAIARRDGLQWTDVGGSVQGMGSDVSALEVFDDGSGPALYAAGRFVDVGGVSVLNVARWDGVSWSEVGVGLWGGSAPHVRRLLVHDDGSGPALYACGTFTTAGAGSPAMGLARWNGSSWEGMAPGLPGTVQTMAVFDDGGGPGLYVGGGAGIRRWDGASWSEVGTNRVGPVFALAVHDDGTGPALYAGGGVQHVDGSLAQAPVRWDGVTWTETIDFAYINPVYALASYDDGNGAKLYAGGGFYGVTSGQCPQYIAAWDGVEWTSLSSAPACAYQGASLDVLGLEVLEDDGVPTLFVGGGFEVVLGDDGVATNRAARWTGQWAPIQDVRGIFGIPRAFTTMETPEGPRLVAGGDFWVPSDNPYSSAHNIGTFDGSTWNGLPSEDLGPVNALAWFARDGGSPELYAGVGAANYPVPHVVRWDGTDWNVVGRDLDGRVHALAVFDDGSGPALYAGGGFRTSGSLVVDRVARWDGTAWSALDGGLPRAVRALAVHDDGHGPALWAGGDFDGLVARWDGAGWSFPAGGHVGQAVRALATWNDGAGGPPVLVAGGSFDRLGGADALNLAKWDGAEWTALGGTDAPTGAIRSVVEHWPDATRPPALFVSGEGPELAWFDGQAWHRPAEPFAGGEFVRALASLSIDDERSLWVGGDFQSVGSVASAGLAQLVDPCAPHHPETRPYCTAKVTSAGCLPFVATAGVPSATATAPFAVQARGVDAATTGLVLYGDAPGSLSFHGGTLCVRAPVHRWIPPVGAASAGGGPCDGVLARDFNARIASGVDPALTAGHTSHLQWVFRDPADPAGFGDGLTNGTRFTVVP